MMLTSGRPAGTFPGRCSVVCSAVKLKPAVRVQRPPADAFGRPYQRQQQQQQQRQQQQQQQQQQQVEDDTHDSTSSDGRPGVSTAGVRSSGSNNVVPFPLKGLPRVVVPPPSPDTATADPATTTISSSSSSSSGVVIAPAEPSTGTSTSGCPFAQALASLQQLDQQQQQQQQRQQEPPLVKLTWWQRVWQITQPYRMQALVLQEALAAGHSMVQLQQHLALEAAYVPGTGPAVRAVLAGDGGSDPCTGPSLVPFFVELMGDESLLVLSGPQHKHLRSLLAPAFSPEAVAAATPEIVQLVGRHLQEWAAAGDEGVLGLDALKLLTFEFIVQLVFGRPYSRPELLSLHSTYQAWINGLPAWPWLNLPLTPYAAALRARGDMMAHFQAAVEAGRARAAAGEEVGGLLGAMLAAVDEAGNSLSDQQICDNVLLLLFAGHDTSSTTLTACLSNLQDNPRVLQRFREEQAAVVARHGGELTAAALRDMPYAEAVIRETLRLDPVVQMLFRVALKDFQLDGYTVPAGKQLLLPLKYLATHDPRWEQGQQQQQQQQQAPAAHGPREGQQEGAAAAAGDARAFVPERLLTPSGQKGGDLMPFGHGARYCLGSGLAMAEMKVLLALLARHYSFAADNDTRWVHTIARVPKNGLPLVVKPLTPCRESVRA